MANVDAVAGLRGTGEFGTDFRPTNYRELFTFLEPNGMAPLNALLAMTESQSTNDPKYNNFRDEMPDRSFTVSATGTNNGSSDTAGTIVLTAGDDYQYLVVGSLIVNSATGEVMRVTADPSSTTVTVTRGVGSTGASATIGDLLFVAGFAAQEGTTSSTAVSFDPTTDFNYTQIFRQSVEVTGTLQHTYLRTGNKEDEVITKGLKLHMSDIERAMFFGKRHQDTSVSGTTARPVRYTGGLTTLSGITTTDIASYSTPNTMSENDFDQLLIETIFAYGSKQKIAFVGARIASLMQRIGKNRWQPTQINGGYGVQFTRYSTFAGDLMVYLHPQFRQIPNQSGNMYILDLPYLKYRYMEGRDTDLLMNRQANDADTVKHEFMTECGLELLHGRPHSIIKNWTALA